MAKRSALISVSDKRGVVDLARELVSLGWEVVSTGGTAKALEQAGVPVTSISEVTGFPEILDGRLKTLHPAVHGGILARPVPEHMQQLAENGINPIDLVVVNLYPFRETVARKGVTLDEAIENIDIGGPTMVRAAAKNHERVAVVVNPERYAGVVEEIRNTGGISAETRWQLTVEAFVHTASYDQAIAAYLTSVSAPGQEGFPDNFILAGQKIQELRYGENPHQQAAFYLQEGAKGAGVATATQLQGKELSYNNIVDLESAFALAVEFDDPAAVIIKHTNPCGTALGATLAGAYRSAFDADPVSAFGGVVGVNREVDAETADEMVKIFLEAVIAPGFSPEALEILGRKEGLRLLATGDISSAEPGPVVKKVSGGFLVQDPDIPGARPGTLKVVTKRQPAPDEINELLFAFKVVKHVKSNAIVVSSDNVIIGVGAGQMNRVGAARIALEQAGEKARGAVLASDAFFPFPDTVEEAAKAGVVAIIQPGGSIKDDEAIAACDAHGIAMMFTGLRHFKH